MCSKSSPSDSVPFHKNKVWKLLCLSCNEIAISGLKMIMSTEIINTPGLVSFMKFTNAFIKCIPNVAFYLT